MDSVSIIDVKLEEIANQIKKESKNIKLAKKQCEQISKSLEKICK